MRTVDKPDTSHAGIGSPKPKTPPGQPVERNVQVPGARPGVVSDGKGGPFRTVPTIEVDK